MDDYHGLRQPTLAQTGSYSPKSSTPLSANGVTEVIPVNGELIKEENKSLATGVQSTLPDQKVAVVEWLPLWRKAKRTVVLSDGSVHEAEEMRIAHWIVGLVVLVILATLISFSLGWAGRLLQTLKAVVGMLG